MTNTKVENRYLLDSHIEGIQINFMEKKDKERKNH